MTLPAVLLIAAAGPTVARAAWDAWEWLGWGASVVGFVVSVVGLTLTYRQAQDARRSADAARDAAARAQTAAEQAVRAVDERATIRDIAQIRSALDPVVVFLQAAKYEQAVFYVRVARERLIELRERAGIGAQRPDLQAVVAGLAEVEQRIATRLYAEDGTEPVTFDLPTVYATLAEYADVLTAWSEHIRSPAITPAA